MHDASCVSASNVFSVYYHHCSHTHTGIRCRFHARILRIGLDHMIDDAVCAAVTEF